MAISVSNQLAAQNKIGISSLSLPKGGGAIQGIGETFQANEFSGTASLSVPIFASPCRDFTPQLAFNYSSGSGNSPWGMGFSLSLPQITRQTRQGTPRYQDSDVFVLSGAADLVPLDQTPRTETVQGISYTIQTFVPRQEGLFALIEYWQPADVGQSFWKVTSKDHTISIFGKTSQAKIADPNNPSHVFSWLLEESYNTTGDHQLFVYKPENTDHVPVAIYDQNRIVTANRYIERVQYGNQKPVSDSILLNPAVDPGIWHFEVVFDYGEYNITPLNLSPYQPVSKWECRPDPFSRYEAGFEIRTYRRCLHTLMFHRFPQELGDNPILVHATAYTYQANTAQLSECIAVTDTGYSYDSEKDQYTTASLPSLSLSYKPFEPRGHSFTLFTGQPGETLMGLNERPHYTLIDLFGEGIPGILHNDQATTYYRAPDRVNHVHFTGPGPQPLDVQGHFSAKQAGIRYGAWEVLDTFPSQRAVQEAGVLLQDQTGHGQLDVILSKPGMQGYWEAQADHTWKPFQTLPLWPADFPVSKQTWVDVTGDGIPDLIQLTEGHVRVYPNKRRQGFGSPMIVPTIPGMPVSLAGSSVEVITFADMAGSGQSHLVRIRTGEVVYWPNLSYGRFGEAITMAHAPDFGPDFNPSRLFLADLDGSGAMDLIYFQHDQALIYLNQSGNAFSEVIILPLPAFFDNLNQVTFADIYGRGNECLVISELHAMPHPRYWCYDFCQQQKPYLLYQVDNNLGASTTITYGSSVDFYLADKKAGLPWLTPLPFPVQVITQLTHTDAISGSKYVSKYAYHHGYYDGVERAFRGFGRVDRQDAEYSYVNPKQLIKDPLYGSPSLSRTWYHTGAHLEDKAISLQYQKEYYHGDADAFAFPDSSIDWNGTIPDGKTIRQAYAALAGTVLRTELYGLDDTPESIHPYSVSESNFLVKLQQPKGGHPYAIFYVHPEQSISYTYERNPADPQIHQSCVLTVDAYGNVKESCAIAYPRRNVPEALPEQQQLHVTCATQSYVNQPSPNSYLLGVPIESQSYEVTTLVPPAGAMLSLVELKQGIRAALGTLSPSNPSSTQAKLLDWGQLYYTQVDRQDANTLLPLGQVALPLLIGQQHVAEFSQDQVTAAFQQTPLQGEALQQKLQAGYYQLDPTSNYWWNTGLTAQYNNLSEFYSLVATVDPAGNKTTYAYDPFQLLLTQVTDALGNAVKIQCIDYQHVAPMQLVDVNGNISEIKLDPLGRVVYSSHYGHEAGKSVGFVPLSQAPIAVPDSLQAVIDNPAKYLGNTQSYFYYDPFAWQKRQEPVVGLSLMAEQYPNASNPSRIQIHLSYNDGFGRTLCSKAKVEPGDAFLYDPLTHQVREGYTHDRWLTTGRVAYNNKGNPVKQYEPYYINTPAYLSNPILDTFGVTAILYYDSLDRVTHTITPKGYLQQHTWTPWEESLHDAHDTFINSPYCQVNVLQPDDQSIYYDHELSSQDRLAIAAAIQGPHTTDFPQPSTELGKALVYGVQYFTNTPNRSIMNNLGQVIQTQRIQRSKDLPQGEVLTNYYTYDIVGRQLTSADPRLHDLEKHNFITTYSLTGIPLQVVSADAGIRWALSNTLGNPIWSYDARQVTTTPSYDVLHRPTQLHVYKPSSEKDPLVLDQVVERLIYGDTPGAVPNPADYNLKGQVYQHYDQAGLITLPSYSLLGDVLTDIRQLRIDYKQEANWGKDSLRSLLQPVLYKTSTSYDALGRIIQAWDVDHNTTVPTYHPSGLLNQVNLTTANDQQTKQVVQGITYNAKGQRLSVCYDNGTTTTYTYDLKTWELTNLKTVNQQGKVLQELVYVYDPVGNVVAKTDRGQATVYYKNQVVNPTARYVYDSLYRLIEGSGREKIGNSQDRAGREIPLISTAPHANDNTALQNYIEQYTYDRGNNLIRTQHLAQVDSWTREMIVSNTSNRAVISTINGTDHFAPAPGQVDQYFDGHGNQIKTQQLHPLRWDYRNNLQQATTVTHAEGTTDTEYYVYDGAGKRVRKVYEQYGHGETSVTIQETIYFGAVEYRRTFQGSSPEAAVVHNEYHSLRVMDDQQCVTTRDYWVVGEPPSGFQNPCWRYQLADYLGSCTVEVDNQGNQVSYEEYTPFGASLLFIGSGSASQLKHYRYSGQECDSITGFYYYGARYYAPWLARWLSPDPGGPVDGLNIYAFVSDDPESFWDVGGMMQKNNLNNNKIGKPNRMQQQLNPRGGLTNSNFVAQNSSSSSSSANASATNTSNNNVEQKGITSSKFRVARLLQGITGTGRNILTVKYKADQTRRTTYVSMFSMAAQKPEEKLTMPKVDQLSKKPRGHTEGIMAAIMQQEKIQVPNQKGDYNELKLPNQAIQYFSSTNKACSTTPHAENCAKEVVPTLLKTAPGSQFYYNIEPNSDLKNKYSIHAFDKATDTHYQNEYPESDSESEADFYVVEKIDKGDLDRTQPDANPFKAIPLKNFNSNDNRVKEFFTLNKKSATSEERLDHKSAVGRSLFRHFNPIK